MIVGASRRTDLPAFYAPWLMNRLRAGEVLVPYPRRRMRLARIGLAPGQVDALLFWSKNPAPLLPFLDELEARGLTCFLQYTLNPYGTALEPALPPLPVRLETLHAFAARWRAQRIVWRYDPIVVTTAFPAVWHEEQFEKLCKEVAGAVRGCVISFVDRYRHLRGAFDEVDENTMRGIARVFAGIAGRFGLSLATCAESLDLEEFGITHGACIDANWLREVTGRPFSFRKDPGQRAACRCVASVDIGAYDTCLHGCAYCYATTSAALCARRHAAHHPDSPLLIGYPQGTETIIDRL